MTEKLATSGPVGARLPAGLEIRERGSFREIVAQDQSSRIAYHRLVASGDAARVGAYFYRWWWGTFGDTLSAYILHLRTFVLSDGRAILHDEDLLERTPWDVKRLQRIRAFLTKPSARLAKDLGIPHRMPLEQVHAYFRLYVGELVHVKRSADGRVKHWRHCPLADDLPHPDDWDRYDLQRAQLGLPLPGESVGEPPVSHDTPEIHDIMSRISPETAEGPKCATDPGTDTRHNVAHFPSGGLLGESVGEPPVSHDTPEIHDIMSRISGPCARDARASGHGHGPQYSENLMAMAMAMADPEENLAPGADPEPVAAVHALLQMGLEDPERIIRLILEHKSRQGPRWALCWCEWIGHCWRRFDDPTAILVSRVHRACEGDAEAQDPPGEWKRWTEKQAQRAKSIERTASVVAPRQPPSPAPPELQPHWRRFLARVHQADSTLRRAVEHHVRRVSREGDGLVAVCAGEVPRLLSSETERLARLARQANPDLPGMRFAAERGSSGAEG